MPRPDRESSFDSDHQSHNGDGDDDGSGSGGRQSPFVNSDDGLKFCAMDEVNRQQRILQELEEDGSVDGGSEDGVEFPTTVLVTGFDHDFFEDESLKERLESLFLTFGSDASFYYFRSFKRVRVSYSSAASAVEARLRMHLCLFGDYTLKCYFGQILKKRNDKSDGFLHPPTPDKQFLISPPASPPVDWEPSPESHPILDYELIAALSKLGPGDTHELHKPEYESHPSIVVQIADDEALANEDRKAGGCKFAPTKRPELSTTAS